MRRGIYCLAFWFCSLGWAFAQVEQVPSKDIGPGEAPPRYEHDSSVSSSRDTKIDISAPKDDDKNHPNSGASVSNSQDANSDVQEMHPWDPHKAAKDVEVGDFYFKRKNYHAALDRYEEALTYKPDDALANYRMAECYEKLDDSDEALAHYQGYLKILPHGPLAEAAQKAVHKLSGEKAQASTPAPSKP